MNRNRLSSQQPKAALKQEARRDSLKLGSRRLPLNLGSAATAIAQRPLSRSDKEGCASTDTALKWFLRDCPSQCP